MDIIKTALSFLSFIPLLLGVLFVVLNYIYLYLDLKNRQLGKNQRVSLVFAVPQLFLAVGWLLCGSEIRGYVSGWAFVLIAVADPAVWRYLLALFRNNFGVKK